MSWNRNASRKHQLTDTAVAPGRRAAAPGAPGRPGPTLRRLLSPVAVALLAAGSLAGCGDADDPAETDPPTVAESQESTGDTSDEATDETDDGTDGTDDSDGADGTDGTDGSTGDDGTDGSTGDDGDSAEPTDDSDPNQENLFEGTWGFGHDSKVLSAEELAALIEEEALDRGPDEMHLTVECEDGVDTGAGDDEATCVAIADEGVEHPWAVTVGPADAGLEIEIENVG